MLVKYKCLNCGWAEQVELELPITHTCKFLGKFTRRVSGIAHDNGFDDLGIDGDYDWMDE